MRVLNSTYSIKFNNEKDLLDLGFSFNPCTESYTYTFPLQKYKKYITLRGCITIESNSHTVKVDVYKADGNYYSPFYGVRWGKYDELLDVLNKKILDEFKRLGIEKEK